MLDLLLKNGRIVDGTGNPWYRGDVGICGGEIVSLGRVEDDAREELDLGGQMISPGFIDAHCHSDLMLLDHPESEIKLQQGVTSELIGNCGIAPAPLSPDSPELLKGYVSPVLGKTERDWTWHTVSDFLEAISESRPAENVATLVGHGSLRIAVMGFENRPASAEELESMKSLLREGMAAGAVGLSIGLMYAPGSYTLKEELAELCKVLPEQGGLLATHIRGEGNSLLESLKEVLWVAENAGVPLHVSHLKAAGKSNWGKVHRAMELLEAARGRGMDVTCDVYPYTAGSTTLTSLLPTWVLEGGIPQALERLSDSAARESIRKELAEEQEGWDNLVASTGWDSVYISSAVSPGLEGEHLARISQERFQDPVDCMMDLLLENDGDVGIVFFHMDEEDVERVVVWERALVASDSLHCGAEKPHPRLYGTFPRLLSKYARERGALTLEQAVRKITSFPAQRFGFDRRGMIVPGYVADLVVFDPEEIDDVADYENPKRYPKGVSRVFVAGRQVIENGVHLGERPGGMLNRG